MRRPCVGFRGSKLPRIDGLKKKKKNDRNEVTSRIDLNLISRRVERAHRAKSPSRNQCQLTAMKAKAGCGDRPMNIQPPFGEFNSR